MTENIHQISTDNLFQLFVTVKIQSQNGTNKSGNQ